MNLGELKKKSPAELITHAEKLSIENPSTLRKQEILFAILKKLAQKNEQITGGGTLEVLQDGFGFLRAIESNYLPGPDDIYVSPSQIRKFGLRTGDSIEGEIRAPKYSEKYFAIIKISKIKKKTIFLGIAYSFQKCRRIPANKHDFKLDYIFTERGIISSNQ